MSRALGRTRRAAVLGVTVLALAGTTGCTYWRLNTFRKQLARFRDNVAVAATPTPTVEFRHPVLEPRDMEWLTGLAPSSVEPHPPALRTRYEFQKMYPEGEQPETVGQFDLPVEVWYQHGKLARVEFCDRIGLWLQADTLQDLLEKASEADVNAGEKAASWSVAGGNRLPDLDDLLVLCGAPYEQAETNEYRVLRYRYAMPNPGPTATAMPCGEAALTFRKSDGRLDVGEIRVGHMEVLLRLNSSGKGSIAIKRRS